MLEILRGFVWKVVGGQACPSTTWTLLSQVIWKCSHFLNIQHIQVLKLCRVTTWLVLLISGNNLMVAHQGCHTIYNTIQYNNLFKVVTQGVVAHSPKPGAHDKSAWQGSSLRAVTQNTCHGWAQWMLWVLQITIVYCTLSLLTNCYRCTYTGYDWLKT